jgi:Spy/CpxP family protein refolding chaperone
VFPIVLVASLALASAASAQPQPPRGGPPGPPPGGPPKLGELVAAHADELGLDAATVASIRRLAEASEPELESLHEAMRSAMEGGDREAIEAAGRALHERMRSLMDQVRALLTDEQWEALRTLLPPPPPDGPPPPPCR